MELLFNGNLIEDPIPWSSADRAFQYGDGYFETMLYRNGKVSLLSQHLDRIHKAAAVFRFKLEESEFRFLEENIETLAQVNEIESEFVRAKLMIWRRSTGQKGYRTSEDHVNRVLMVFPHDTPVLQSGVRIGVSQEAMVTVNKWSALKTINALPWVLAGMECRERGLDDLIMLNASGQISECIESNIFWSSGSQWYTPSLSTGCTEGTMRSFVLDQFRKRGTPVKEVNHALAEVQPDMAFTCRASGFGLVSEWDKRALKSQPQEPGEWLDTLDWK